MQIIHIIGGANETKINETKINETKTKETKNIENKNKEKIPFHVVMIVDSTDEIIRGIWILQEKTIYIPETQCYSNVVHVAYETSKDAVLCLEAILGYVLNEMQEIDVMYMFQMGTLTREVLEKNKAVETGEMYLDFYNFINNQTLPSNIHLFLL
jgi:hypothetical protein